MRVRVTRNCYQPLEPSGRNKCLNEGVVVDWKMGPVEQLPGCFEPLAARPAPEPVFEKPPQQASPMMEAFDRDAQIIEAMNRLDHGDEGLWTDAGLPRVEAISLELEALGFNSEVTRAEINVAQPGFVRRQT